MSRIVYTQILLVFSDIFPHTIGFPDSSLVCWLIFNTLYLLCVYDRVTSFIIPLLLSSACKTDQANFSEWMSFLPSIFMKETSPKTEALGANT